MDQLSGLTTIGAAASRDVLDAMVALRICRRSYALATVIETRGSTSATKGSKAVIDEGGRVLAGWVGGGCAESTVCHSAIAYPKSGESAIVDIDLTSEALGAGMPCGGDMRVYVEPVRPHPQLWIQGHGKIAEVLCDSDLVRVRAPAGLDLGAETPEEIAFSILSEIIMLRRKADGVPRSQKTGPMES